MPGRPQREYGDDRRQQPERAGPARRRAQAVHQVQPREAQLGRLWPEEIALQGRWTAEGGQPMFSLKVIG